MDISQTHLFWKYFESLPEDTVAYVFTHQNDKRLFSPDRKIRKFLAWRHKISYKEAFSHTGTIWQEEEGTMYYDQTYPRFRREVFRLRNYNKVIVIKDADLNRQIKSRIKEFYLHRRRYGILQLLAMAIPTLTFGLVPTPIGVGMVCSEAVIRSFPLADGRKKSYYDNVDPVQAYNTVVRKLKEHNIPFEELTIKKTK